MRGLTAVGSAAEYNWLERIASAICDDMNANGEESQTETASDEPHICIHTVAIAAEV